MARSPWTKQKIEAREDAIVKRLLKQPVSVVVLGGAHDLSDNVKRMAGVEYIRVEVKALWEFAGGIRRAGLGLVVAAIWYWLSIRWVDLNDQW